MNLIVRLTSGTILMHRDYWSSLQEQKSTSNYIVHLIEHLKLNVNAKFKVEVINPEYDLNRYSANCAHAGIRFRLDSNWSQRTTDLI